MSNLNIVLTIDYEIFGNGSGDVRWCLIEPTEKILEIAEKHNIPITLMAEICEYWAFEKEERKGNLPNEYTPAIWIRDQLIRCIKNRHDVQLHIHPQWINYSYHLDENRWEVDFNYWMVPSLAYEEIYEILKKGKQELENMLKPFYSDYECFVFRAGALSIQPEKHVLKALMDSGFKIDTTVAIGCCSRNNQNYFDFKEISRKPYWFVKENLRKEVTTGILEMPIYTVKYSLLKKFYYKYIRKKKKINTIPNNCNGYSEYTPKNSFINRFFPSFKMFDICGLKDYEMTAMLNNAEKEFSNYTIIPIVAIGHSKSFNDPQSLESFIKIALDKDYKFTTFKDIINQVA